jgi:tetratricopeptide (TPR) repeat protein
LRNRVDAHRLGRHSDHAAHDLTAALDAFQAIGDRRWTARSRVSMAGLCRLQQDWTAGRQHLDAALSAFRDIGDRPAEARALRELGLLLRDQGELENSGQALDASQEIFTELGDKLWTARILVSKAVLEELRGADAVLAAQQAAEICRQCGITSEDSIARALKEW